MAERSRRKRSDRRSNQECTLKLICAVRRQVSSAFQQETILMENKVRHIFITLALTLIAATLAPINANAAPLLNTFHSQLQPPATKIARYTFTLYNNTYISQEFTINGKTHAVLPHYGLIVKAPAGTEVYAASKIGGHPRGSLLFTVTPQNEGQQLVFNSPDRSVYLSKR
jgi:hypothetical protein